MVSGQCSGQCGKLSVVSGQWAVGGGQWTVGSGQCSGQCGITASLYHCLHHPQGARTGMFHHHKLCLHFCHEHRILCACWVLTRAERSDFALSCTEENGFLFYITQNIFYMCEVATVHDHKLKCSAGRARLGPTQPLSSCSCFVEDKARSRMCLSPYCRVAQCLSADSMLL